MKAKLTTKTIHSLTPGAKRYDVRDTELPGFLLRVAPSGEMTYSCDYYRPDGRRTKVKLGSAMILTPQQARDEALKILGDRAKGNDPAATRKIARQETLGAFIETHYKPWAEANLKTGVETVRRVLSQFADFKDKRLTDLSPWLIDKWRTARLNDGVKQLTINRDFSILRAALSKAVEWNVIPYHPLSQVKPLKTDPFHLERFLSIEEEILLRKALDEREERIRKERRSRNEWLKERSFELLPDLDRVTFADYLKPMVLVALNTGMRRGALFDLKREDVSFPTRTYTLAGASAKGGRTKRRPLTHEAFETLSAWLAQSDGKNERVFPDPKTGNRFKSIRNEFEKLVKDAGIKDFRFHDLRHTFASRLAQAGVDLNTIRELLTHTDIKLTQRYAHLSPQTMADAVATLDRARHQATVTLIAATAAPTLRQEVIT